LPSAIFSSLNPICACHRLPNIGPYQIPPSANADTAATKIANQLKAENSIRLHLFLLLLTEEA
jgi:hypothetical protein